MSNENHGSPKDEKKLVSEAKVYRISEDQLPLSCPMDDMALWNAHPKVYLPIHKTGEETCPYCGSKFILERSE